MKNELYDVYVYMHSVMSINCVYSQPRYIIKQTKKNPNK